MEVKEGYIVYKTAHSSPCPVCKEKGYLIYGDGVGGTCPECEGFKRKAFNFVKPLKIKAYFTDNGFWWLNPTKPIYMHKEFFFENENDCWQHIAKNGGQYGYIGQTGM